MAQNVLTGGYAAPSPSRSDLIVWLVNQSTRLRWVLSQALNEHPGICCTMGFRTSGAVVDLLMESDIRPDVILLDISTQGNQLRSWIEAINNESPQTRILTFSPYCDFDCMGKAPSRQETRRFRNSRYISEIVHAIRGGKHQFASTRQMDSTWWLNEAVVRGCYRETYGLTQREKAVLKLAIKGKTMSQIADDLDIRYNTMIAHFRNIHAKLGVHNRAELVLKVVHEQLVE